MSSQFLRAFNDQLILSDAYNWNRIKIYAFLNNVLSNNGKFGILPEEMVELGFIKQELLRLCIPSGRDYNIDPNLRPNQHIYRAGNSGWQPSRRQPQANTSRFILRNHLHNARVFSNPYDLLGLFLSSLGPAPIGATKANFYLPLTAVYGRWCAQIAGSAIGGVGYVPAVFQCTWRIADGIAPQFFLGSSIAGYTEAGTGTWPSVVRKARFNLLFPNGNFDQSPSRTLHGNTGTRYGSCAETHPFLELLRGSTFDQGVCYGIALQSNYFIANDYSKNINLGQLAGSSIGPCVNCRELIHSFNGDTRNFSA